MHPVNRLLISWLLCPSLAAFAQAPAATKADPAADAAWLNVVELAKPLPAVKSAGAVQAAKLDPVAGKLTEADLPKSPVRQQIDRFQQAAQSAKDFHTKYPDNARAAEARKLEVVLALQGAQLGGEEPAPTVTQLCQAYRADQRNPVKDRFDVAVIMGTMASSQAAKGKRLVDDGAAREKLADALRDEFGDIPEVHYFYLGVARTADPATAARVARKLAKMKPAPDSVRSAAQKIVDRNDLIGQKLDLPLTTAEGQTFNLKSLTGQPTVVFVYDAQSGTGDMAALARFRSLVPTADTRWVYIALGGIPPRATPGWKADTEMRFYGPSGFNNPTAERLKLQQTPYVYVLDAQARLTGFGRVEDLPALFAAANR